MTHPIKEFAIAGDKTEFIVWKEENFVKRRHVKYIDKNNVDLLRAYDNGIIHRIGNWRTQHARVHYAATHAEGHWNA